MPTLVVGMWRFVLARFTAHGKRGHGTRTRAMRSARRSNGDGSNRTPIGSCRSPACIAILLFVRYLYRRDAGGVAARAGWFLTALRSAVFFGLLILFLQPHWRSEREVVRNSRVLLLVDTSLSMGLTDGESSSSVAPEPHRPGCRGARRSDFLARLRKVHDVAVFPFSEELKADRMVMLGKETAKMHSLLPLPLGEGPGVRAENWRHLRHRPSP